MKRLDSKFRSQDRKVIILVDNFSGHKLPEGTNLTHIRLEFSAPNMTAHVQPMDGGLIRLFKANYRAEQCRRAVLLDETGEENIYRMDFLDVVTIVRHTQ